MTEPGLEYEPVDDGFDLMTAFFVEADARFPAKVGDFAVDASADKTFTAEFFDDVAEFSRLVAHDGGKENKFALRRKGEDGVGDFLRALTADQFPRLGIVRQAERGVEDAEVVVDFRGGRDGRTRAGRGGALFDGDGRGKSFDEVHVGTLEAVEKLAGVGREAFDIFALSLGVEGVEGEGRFAGATRAGQDDKPVPRYDHVDILQVVLAGAFNADRGGFGGRQHA